jgi:ABC-type sugar transport system permease subunit
VTTGTLTTKLRPTGRRRSIRRRPVGYLFVAPIVVFFLVFVGYPFLRSFYLALTSWSGLGTPDFVGLRNFQVMADDPVFWKSLGNTFLFTGVTTVLQTALPLLLAVLLNQGWRAGVLFRTLIFIPAVISLVVTGVLWQLIYEPNFGTLNEVLRSIGLGSLSHPWLADPHTVLPSMMVVSLWQSLGLFMLIYLAGLQSINPTLYEAASIDGASARQKFFSITVPMLRRVSGVVIILNLINGFKTFDMIYVMTGGGPNHASEVLGTYLYGLAFGSTAGAVPALGYATAISMVIFVLCLAATLIQLRISRRSADVD